MLFMASEQMYVIVFAALAFKTKEDSLSLSFYRCKGMKKTDTSQVFCLIFGHFNGRLIFYIMLKINKLCANNVKIKYQDTSFPD